MTILRELGVKRFLEKPIRSKDLVDEVESALTEAVTSHTSSDESMSTLRDASSVPQTKIDRLHANLEAAEAETRKLRERLRTSDLELHGLRAAKQTRDIGAIQDPRRFGLADHRAMFGGSHADRVARLTSNLATRLELRKPVIKSAEAAALLHDIGKICIPDVVAWKHPSQLSIADVHAYRRHPVAGQRIIEQTTLGRNLARIVRAHHEAFDGNGFPDGVSGFEIPLESRLIAVADVIDRSVYHGPTDQPSPARARAAIRQMEGTALDPDLIESGLAQIDELEESGTNRRTASVSVFGLSGGELLGEDIVSIEGIRYRTNGSVITTEEVARLHQLASEDIVSGRVVVLEASEPS